MRQLPDTTPLRLFVPALLLIVVVVLAPGCATKTPTTSAPEEGLRSASADTSTEPRRHAPAKRETDPALETLEWALRDLAAKEREENAVFDWEGPVLEPADVAERHDPASRDQLAVPEPEIEPEEAEAELELIEDAPPTFDIPIEINDKVLAWVDVYSKRNPKGFQPGLVRSGRYLPMFRKIFQEEGLPQDLVYMAHVESAYKPYAYSRAGAKGVFQFISSTGRRYGLRIDYWVDERSDPEKAAYAATRYLKDLYAMFGDWYLALAAYNAGEGKVQRALRRSGRDDFWGIARTNYIRRETKNYVPAIIAATLISKEPEKYGFHFTPEPPVAYDTIQVKGAADLRVIAKCAGTDYETLKALNPALRRQQTPARGTSDVRVPVGTGPTAIAALDKIPAGDRVVVIRHRVKRGDTLWDISREYGVPVSAIQQNNGMGRRTRIQPGQILKVPRNGSVEWAGEAELITYRVRGGDTLSSIARRHGTTSHAIARESNIGVNSILRIGQRLEVPAGMRVASTGSGTTVHTVRRGDTLWRIANRYRVSVNALCAENRIAKNATIYPGTKLKIPAR